MSTAAIRSKSAVRASSEASSLGALPDPALHNVLQRACANSNQADLANLLMSSKKIRSEALACCKGLVQLQYTTAKTASEAEAFAQWLGRYGQLASSLKFCTAVIWDPNADEDTVDVDLMAQLAVEAEHNRALIEGAVATGLQLAANNDSESAGPGLYLQACSLYDAGPNIAAVLQQLPASCLTSLQLEITQPTCSDDSPGTYLRPLCSSFVHLTKLESLALAFRFTVPIHGTYHVDADPLIKQRSCLTNLTSLQVPLNTDASVLEDLPASLQSLELQWHGRFSDYPSLSLGHLTALTNLEGVDHVRLCSNDQFDFFFLPPNLLKLKVADIHEVHPLLPLTKLEALRLSEADYAAEADLQELTVLTALSYVEFGSYSDSEKLKVIRPALAGLPNLRHIVLEDSTLR